MGATVSFNNANNSSGSQMNISQNGISIELNQAHNLDLWGGRNGLVPIVQGNGNAVYGTLTMNCSVSQLKQLENHWNTRTSNPKGASPIFGTDYFTYNYVPGSAGCLNPINLRDNGLSLPPIVCQTGAPGNGGGGNVSSSSLNPLNHCPGCQKISSPSFSNQKLNEAVQMALQQTTINSPAGDDSVAAELLIEILSVPIVNPNASEGYLLNLAYQNLLQSYSRLLSSGKISPLKAQNTPSMHPLATKSNGAASRNAQNTVGSYRKFKKDKAGILRSVGSRNGSINILDSLVANSSPAETAFLDYLGCIISAEEEVLQGRINLADFESTVLACQNSNKSEWIEAEVKLPKANIQALYDETWDFEIIPNPASNTTEIVLFGNMWGSYTCSLFSMNGKIVTQSQFSSEEIKVPINLQGLPKGVYAVKVASSSGVQIVKRLLIQ